MRCKTNLVKTVNKLMESISKMEKTQTNVLDACNKMADAILEVGYKIKDLEIRVRKLENKSKS